MKLSSTTSLNVFGVVNDVTSRIEPFHSQFLASLLACEHTRDVLSEFIKLCIPADIIASENLLDFSTGIPAIESEFMLNSGERVDIVIHFPERKFVIAIEVKTADTSTTNGQLQSYVNGLSNIYPTDTHKIYIVYLTPFNLLNIPNTIPASNSCAVQEYSRFSQNNEQCVHLNWDQVIKLYDQVGCTDSQVAGLLMQHSIFISSHVSNLDRFKTALIERERNRGLVLFLGEQAVDSFFTSVEECGIYKTETDAYITFELDKNIYTFSELIRSLLLLLQSDNLSKRSVRSNKIDDNLITDYTSGRFGGFYKALFSELSEISYVWLEGAGNIGVRALHQDHRSSGVSVFTLTPDSVRLSKNR